MAQKAIRGISGVLGGILTQEEALPASQTHEETREQVASNPPPVRATVQPEPAPVEETRDEKRPKVTSPSKGGPQTKTQARKGRPPAGTRTSEPVEREKVSLRLRADLAATYRDWSWDEHCQFSDLVDRAMESYLKSRGKARKPEKE